MEHFAGPVTRNQLISLGISNCLINFFISQGMSFEDILDVIVSNM